MILVTEPFLPPLDEYKQLVNNIWKNKWLTNMGPLANKLEKNLKNHLDVSNLLFVTNGTIALQIAIKALNLKGEIITTPLTYVATTSSIVWEGCTPVFVDIDAKSLNIDASKIESAITEKTSAILATHVYGNPCDVEKIQKIAEKYKLKVIYDAAHAFGVKVKGVSIFDFGDISTCSTHATKLFHTCEGGFVVTKDKDLLFKMKYMRNFGHDGPDKFHGIGINGKISEFHSAMGLINLKYIAVINNNRKKITERYSQNLTTLKAFIPKWHKASNTNYAYYPIVFESEELLLKSMTILKNNEIFGRRYFYPSLTNSLPYVESINLEMADNLSKRVFCLPLYHTLKIEEVDLICNLLLSAQNS